MEIRRLTADDTEACAELFDQNFKLAPIGHLTPRTPDEFGRILNSRNVSAGIFLRDTLVGYHLSNNVADLVYDAQRYSLGLEDITGNDILFAKGALIAPTWRGQGLAGRLDGYLDDQARISGYNCWFGQIYVGNYVSVRAYLVGRRTIVGFSTDEFGLNFISRIDFHGTGEWEPQGECPVTDLDRIGKILERFTVFTSRGKGKAMSLVYGRPANLAAKPRQWDQTTS
jgi:hypothetical protein